METRLMNTTTSLFELDELIEKLPGKVYLPTDAGSEAARAGFNLMDDKHPDVIVMVETPQDVIEAVNFARANGMPISVQATGHRETGSAVGTVLINTARMQDLRVDPRTQTAWVGAGVKWGPVLREALAPGRDELQVDRCLAGLVEDGLVEPVGDEHFGLPGVEEVAG